MRDPDARSDYQVLVATQWALCTAAGAAMAVLLGLWSGMTDPRICLPVGIATAVVTVAAILYAARNVKGATRAFDGWSASMRTMAGINMGVSALLVVFERIP